MSTETIFGRQPVFELLRAGRREIKRLMMAGNVRQASAAVTRLVKVAEKKGLVPVTVTVQDLDRICRSGNHQGLAVEASPYPYVDLEDLLEGPERNDPPLLLVIDHVQDPQNLGSMLRTCESVGVTGVVIPATRAVEVTAAAVRASAGAAEYVRVARVSNLHNALLRMKEAGIRTVGMENEAQAAVYTAADLRGPVALVVGSEGEGMAKLLRDTCDLLVRLPMKGRVGSLNAAVAAAIALYEIRRQR